MGEQTIGWGNRNYQQLVSQYIYVHIYTGKNDPFDNDTERSKYAKI